MAPVRHLPPLTLTSRRMHAQREQLCAIKGRGGKATLGTRKGIAERPTTRASVHHEGTDTLPVNYHGERRLEPGPCTPHARAFPRRTERTAAHPLPSPESPTRPSQCSRAHAGPLGPTVGASSPEEPTQPSRGPAAQPAHTPVNLEEGSEPRRIATTRAGSPREGANDTTAKSTLLQTRTADSGGGNKRTPRTPGHITHARCHPHRRTGMGNTPHAPLGTARSHEDRGKKTQSQRKSAKGKGLSTRRRPPPHPTGTATWDAAHTPGVICTGRSRQATPPKPPLVPLAYASSY
jgi:hypothetical protein